MRKILFVVFGWEKIEIKRIVIIDRITANQLDGLDVLFIAGNDNVIKKKRVIKNHEVDRTILILRLMITKQNAIKDRSI